MGEKSLFYKKFSKEELQNFIDTSKTKKEFMQKIGYKTNSHNLKKLFDRIVQEYDLQNIHFQSTYSTDISDQIFGYLKVLYEDPNNKKMEKHKWICQCLLCGNIVSVRRNSLVSGTTITCGCHFISHGEKSIEDFLKKNEISFQKQKTFSTLKSNKNRSLRFDFYLPEFKTFIEFQGQQHYYASDFFGGEENFQRQISNDKIKREWCNENNYKLIEIPYYEYRNIEKILNELLFKGDVISGDGLRNQCNYS